MGSGATSRSSPVSEAIKLRLRHSTVPDELRDWSVRVFRPVARFALRHWIRHEELVRLRQQTRYLGLAHLLARLREPPVDLTLFELSVFSQNGEDGVLQEILRRLGVAKGTFVEIGAGSNESNCLLLADAFGWSGVFIDADDAETDALSRKYRELPDVQVVRTLVTSSNLQSILRRLEIAEDFDVLSIDIDGNDYWLWKSLEDFRPKVVVVEYNASLPHRESAVQRDDPARRWDGTDSFGASVGALRRLAHSKGYKFVHTELTGTNAFFVRADLAGSSFLSEDDVLVRGPDYFLYGLSHREARERMVATDDSQDREDSSTTGVADEGPEEST